jgi:hypothetical protein
MKMKKITQNLTKFILPLVTMAIVLSCGEEHDFYKNIEYSSDANAKMKFFNAAVGPITGTSGSSVPVNYFLDGNKITSVNVATGTIPVGFGFGGTYPGNIDYSSVAAGTKTLESITPESTSTGVPPVVTPAIVRTTNSIATESGKSYTSFLVGSATTAYKNYFVQDDFSVTTDPTKAYIRFVNTVENTPAGGYTFVLTKNYPATATNPAVSKDLVTISNVNFIAGSTVFIPFEPNVSSDSSTYTLTLKQGTTTVNTLTTFVNPRPTKVYTFVALGSVGLTGTTWAPKLTFYTNR